jgi:hypothetical protein
VVKAKPAKLKVSVPENATYPYSYSYNYDSYGYGEGEQYLPGTSLIAYITDSPASPYGRYGYSGPKHGKALLKYVINWYKDELVVPDASGNTDSITPETPVEVGKHLKLPMVEPGTYGLFITKKGNYGYSPDNQYGYNGESYYGGSGDYYKPGSYTYKQPYNGAYKQPYNGAYQKPYVDGPGAYEYQPGTPGYNGAYKQPYVDGPGAYEYYKPSTPAYQKPYVDGPAGYDSYKRGTPSYPKPNYENEPAYGKNSRLTASISAFAQFVYGRCSIQLMCLLADKKAHPFTTAQSCFSWEP